MRSESKARDAAEARKRIANRIKELQPEASGRAIAKAIGANPRTIQRDATNVARSGKKSNRNKGYRLESTTNVAEPPELSGSHHQLIVLPLSQSGAGGPQHGIDLGNAADHCARRGRRASRHGQRGQADVPGLIRFDGSTLTDVRAAGVGSVWRCFPSWNRHPEPIGSRRATPLMRATETVSTPSAVAPRPPRGRRAGVQAGDHGHRRRPWNQRSEMDRGREGNPARKCHCSRSDDESGSALPQHLFSVDKERDNKISCGTSKGSFKLRNRRPRASARDQQRRISQTAAMSGCLPIPSPGG
jgi:hypothetical protein